MKKPEEQNPLVELHNALTEHALPEVEQPESIDDGITIEKNIREGQYDDDHLEEILQAAHDRVKMVGGRPLYLMGQLATVRKVMQSWCIIDLDHPCQKFFRNIRSPMSILEKIS